MENCGLYGKKSIVIGSCDRKNIHDLETLLNDYSSKGNNFKVSSEVIHDGEKCLEKIISSAPDFIFIDLNMKGKDGLWVLERLREKKYAQSQVIFICYLCCDSVPKISIELGAKKCVKSPFDIDLMKSEIIDIFKNNEFRCAEYGNFNKNVSFKIAGILNRLGIHPGVKGYYYLKTAITEVYKDFEKSDGVTKRLYPYIARVHGTNPGKVERAIRHAIDVSWLKGPEGYNNIFGFTFAKKPTNRQIISQIAEYLRNKE